MRSSLVLGLTVAFAVGCLLFAAVWLVNRNRVSKRFSVYVARYGAALKPGAGEALNLNLESPTRLVWSLAAKFESRLLEANIRVEPMLWLTLTAGGAVCAGLVAALLWQSAACGLLLGFGLHVYFNTGFLIARRRAIAKRFTDDLPGALQLIASSMRAGLSFARAVEALAESGEGEVARQFSIVTTEVSFGMRMEDSLLRVSQRMKSTDLEWLVMALEVHREVGGSLVQILESVSQTIRSRAEVKREVQVLAAEGKLSAYVLTALPIFAFLAISLIRPSYVQFFVVEPIGWVMMAIGFALVGAGWVWTRSLIGANDEGSLL